MCDSIWCKFTKQFFKNANVTKVLQNVVDTHTVACNNHWSSIMSFKTWLKEFYPIVVNKKNLKDFSDVEIVEHSLTKWKGALPKNVEKHKVFFLDNSIISADDQFFFTTDSCSMCFKYYVHTADGSSCDNCPLVLSGGVSCNDVDSEYRNVYKTDDPKGMVKALQKALRYVKNLEKSK